MRRGHKPSFVTNKKGEFIGVNLSSDFCAEHEWGISSLKSAFKVKSSKGYGIDRRIIRAVPPDTCEVKWGTVLRFFKAGPHWCLAYSGASHLKDIEKSGKSTELCLHDKSSFRKEDDDIAGAWDSESFGVLVREKDKDKLEALYEAFKELDIVIAFASGVLIENPGLCLLIASKMDKETKDKLTEIDKDHERLLKVAEETTIERHLKRSGKQWFALSPEWINDNLKKRSKYKVMFWLNPQEQHIYEAGWYTVEDLQAWSEDKGPVMIGSRR